MTPPNKPVLKNQGQAMLTAVIFFMVISATIVLGIANPVLKQVAISKDIINSTQSRITAQSSLEDIVYRLENGKQVATSEILTLNDSTATTTITNTATGKQIVAQGSNQSDIRKLQTDLSQGTGASFHYGVQAGAGGFSLSNSSSITGNVFSDGPITGSGNTISGDAVSTGSSGLISGIHTTGNAYAHTIQNSTVDKDAYYTSISGTTVSGTLHPNSPDQSSADLPISDSDIAGWESDASAGGTASCTSGSYSLSSNTTIGPKEIPCNLSISGSATITLAGPLWVKGNITIGNSATIKISSSLGTQSVAVIADDPANESTGSTISIDQSASFQGSGSTGSFVFLISQNNSTQNGGSTDAISVGQSAQGLIAYAPHGNISITQSVSLKEVTGYKITLKNSSNVVYDSGLANTLFQAGPGGGYDILDWFETQ